MRSSRQLLELAKELGGDERLAFHVRAILSRQSHFGIFLPVDWCIPDAARAVARRFAELTATDPDARWVSVAIIPKPRAGELLSAEDERFLVEIATAHGKSPLGLVSPPHWMVVARAWLLALRTGREQTVQRGQVRHDVDFSLSPILHAPQAADARTERIIVSGVSLRGVDRIVH